MEITAKMAVVIMILAFCVGGSIGQCAKENAEKKMDGTDNNVLANVVTNSTSNYKPEICDPEEK